jgi:hypothetical protein
MLELILDTQKANEKEIAEIKAMLGKKVVTSSSANDKYEAYRTPDGLFTGKRIKTDKE